MWLPVSQRMTTHSATIVGFKILKFHPLPPNERVSPQRDVWLTVQSVQFFQEDNTYEILILLTLPSSDAHARLQTSARIGKKP